MSKVKRTSLDAVFTSEPSAAEPTAPIPKASNDEAGKPAKRPGIKQHTAYLPEPVHEQLRTLAFEERNKIHDYLLEGLNRVFADRGLPSIEDLLKVYADTRTQ